MKYKKFSDEFPYFYDRKEENFNTFSKCRELLDFVESKNKYFIVFYFIFILFYFFILENKTLNRKFNDFPLDEQKKTKIKIRTNKVIESIENKNWWYKLSTFDDFESSNLVSEIENHFSFK
jgi:hypothetical protein